MDVNGNKRAKLHGNTLNLSENIATHFRGLLFLTHTVYTPTVKEQIVNV